jgi:hypothetical protein
VTWSIDVVSCTDRDQAVQLAAEHPLAQQYPIEVRPFEGTSGRPASAPAC